jgi:outer membrane murein-binding lipoprotein Lpp
MRVFFAQTALVAVLSCLSVPPAHAVWRDCQHSVDRVLRTESGSREYFYAAAAAHECLRESKFDALSSATARLAVKRETLRSEQTALTDTISSGWSIIGNALTPGAPSPLERVETMNSLRNEIEETEREVKRLEQDVAELNNDILADERGAREAE